MGCLDTPVDTCSVEPKPCQCFVATSRGILSDMMARGGVRLCLFILVISISPGVLAGELRKSSLASPISEFPPQSYEMLDPGVWDIQQSAYGTSADLNGDGFIDLVGLAFAAKDGSTFPGFHGIAAFLGRGDGTFTDAEPFMAAFVPSNVATADFDRNEVMDLALGSLAKEVTVLLGLPGGGFQPEFRIPVFLPRTLSVAVGDMNQDDLVDIVAVSTQRDSVDVLEGSGDGSFRQTDRAQTGNIPTHVVLNDFNGDGRTDIATSNLGRETGPPSVSVMLAMADGGYSEPILQVDWSVQPDSLKAADIDGDGRTDLLVRSRVNADRRLWFLKGLGDGSFEPPEPMSLENFSRRSGQYPTSYAVSDFDNDARPDVLSALQDVSIAWGSGDGTFSDPVALGISADAWTLGTPDVNDDGIPDLAVASFDGKLTVFLGDGRGGVKLPPRVVDIDVLPGNDRNILRHGSNGLTRVAILGDPVFLPDSLNLDTLQVAGASVARAGAAGKPLCYTRDVNGDELIDMVCFFRTSDLVPRNGLVRLHAQTINGTEIRGEDSVRAVP